MAAGAVWLRSICLIFGTIFQQLAFTDGHHCVHNIPSKHEIVTNVHIEPAHVVKKRSLDQNLRIHLHYDNSVRALPDQKRHLVKNELIPVAVKYWQEALQVRRTGSPIKLLRQCNTYEVTYNDSDPFPYCVRGCKTHTMCGETRVLEKHLAACRISSTKGNYISGYSGEGVSGSDFVLYVSAYSTDRCSIGTTVAYAAYCQLEAALDRPIAGYVNLCPDSISLRPHDIHQMISTIKHEILHALGFSAGLYAFYRDEKGDPLTPRFKATREPPYNKTLGLYQWSEKIARTVVRDDWMVRKGVVRKEATMIVTPNVVREVRAHFNCSTLEGAELEDQGVHGTKLTHWEKRVFENEVMTGTYTQNPTTSRITLALMEDTGWYKVNYDKAEPLIWGRNLGCDFVTKSCLHWMDLRAKKTEHIHPYCNRVKRESLQTECTDERDAVALCNLVQYTGELPDAYQHFHEIPTVDPDDVGQYAGSVQLADYCPYIQEFSWKKGEEFIRGSRCGLDSNNADADINYMLERYGNKSACFEHMQPWSLRHCDTEHSTEHWGSGCYQYECSTSRGLSLIIYGKRYRCYRRGQELKVQMITEDWLHEGIIICPPCQELCQKGDFLCPPEMNPPSRLEQTLLEAPCGLASMGKANFLHPILLLVIAKSTILRITTTA